MTRCKVKVHCTLVGRGCMAQCEILLEAGTAEAAYPNQSLLSLSTDNRTRCVLTVSLSRSPDQGYRKTITLMGDQKSWHRVVPPAHT